MARSKVAQLWEFGKLSAQVGIAQIAIQAIAFVCGILVIRLLPTQEYALYTLANTMLGTMTILADGGIASGVMAEGGKVWQDRKKLGAVLATGMHLRRKFAVFSLLIATPILLYLLHHHGASWLMSCLIALSLIPAFFASLSGRLLEIPSKLHQEVAPLQKIQVASNAGRLGLLTLTLFSFPFAGIAILSSGVAQVYANLRLRKLCLTHVVPSTQTDPVVKREILRIVKRRLPESIFYCISGQASVWILSVFGTTHSVAEIGALGRLAMVYGIFIAIFSTLVSPRYARLSGERKVLLQNLLLINIGLIILAICMVIPVKLLDSEILSLLGKEYFGLESELLLMAISGACGLILAGQFHISSSRGWIINPVIYIIWSLSFQGTGFLLVDLSQISGVLKASILMLISQALLLGAYCILCALKQSTDKTTNLNNAG